MSAYLIRRLLGTTLTLLGVSVIVFLMMELIPGTVVEQLMGQSALVTEESVQALRDFFGLNQPLYVRYVQWIAGVVQGDWGDSWRSHRPVLGLLFEHMEISLELAVVAIAVSLLIGVPLGVISATRASTRADDVVRVGATMALSIPAFWQGALLILLFSKYFGWFPPLDWTSFIESPVENLKMIALPGITLGTASAAMITRMTRSSMLEILRQDYVRTARAKGVRERFVLYRHAFRNALVPVITIAGVQMGYILAGIVVVEDVFSLPGLGRLVLNAIFQRDYPVVQGSILFIAAAFMLMNLLIDLLYVVIDPRVRYS